MLPVCRRKRLQPSFEVCGLGMSERQCGPERSYDMYSFLRSRPPFFMLAGKAAPRQSFLLWHCLPFSKFLHSPHLGWAAFTSTLRSQRRVAASIFTGLFLLITAASRDRTKTDAISIRITRSLTTRKQFHHLRASQQIGTDSCRAAKSSPSFTWTRYQRSFNMFEPPRSI